MAQQLKAAWPSSYALGEYWTCGSLGPSEHLKKHCRMTSTNNSFRDYLRSGGSRTTVWMARLIIFRCLNPKAADTAIGQIDKTCPLPQIISGW